MPHTVAVSVRRAEALKFGSWSRVDVLSQRQKLIPRWSLPLTLSGCASMPVLKVVDHVSIDTLQCDFHSRGQHPEVQPILAGSARRSRDAEIESASWQSKVTSSA